jgi:hypothetical protein
VLVTHDPAMAIGAGRVLQMNDGTLRESDAALADPERDRGRAIVHAVGEKEAVEVGSDRAVPDPELGRDLLVGQAVRG